MDHIVITIARQYGSGGRTVGQMLAERLGIPFYDKGIIRMASEDSGIHPGLFGRVDEYTSAKAPFYKKSSVYTGGLLSPGDKEFTSDENLFNYQAKVIRELAEKESCVIIGRCSNYILRDVPHVLSVFIHAPHDFRMREAMKKISGSERDVEKFLQKDDRRKEEYYHRFAGGQWEEAVNYDLCLDCSKLGFEKCAQAIINHIELLKG